MKWMRTTPQRGGLAMLGPWGASLVAAVALAGLGGCTSNTTSDAAGGASASGGSTASGGSSAGGSSAGGANAGGKAAGGTSAGGANAGGSNSGGKAAGGDTGTGGAGGDTGTGGAGGDTGTAGAGGDTGTAGSGGSAPDPLKAGIPCTKQEDCPSGICLMDEGVWPGGYCSRDCGGAITTEGDPCPKAATCVQVTEASAVCLGDCKAKGDCRDGYACATIDEAGNGVCIPACTSDEACGSRMKCDATSGLCVDAPDALGNVGDTCGADANCTGAKCYDEASTTFPGGYCSAECTEAEAGNACTGGGNCTAVQNDAGQLSYNCFARCATSVDCRSGYVCSADAGYKANDGSGVCIPSCAGFDCGTGYYCDASGVCLESGGTTTYTTSAQDLGTQNIGPTEGEFKKITFDVPDGTISWTLVGDIQSGSSEGFGPVQVKTPTGDVVYDMFDPLKNDFKVKSGGDVPFGALFPNTPRLTIQPGTYEVTLGSASSISAKFDVVFKSGSGPLDGGNLPMVFFFSKNSYLNATSAKTDTAFQNAVNETKSIYASVGITVTVDDSSYIDLDGTESFAVIDEPAEMGQLFKQAPASAPSGLNVFFIDQYGFGGGGILGISGGIPGSPGVHGTVHAGVTVALAPIYEPGGAPELLSKVIAHEGGHYLGLFHLSERDGSSHDPLEDTPQCTADRDTNGDGRVGVQECAGNGSDYLMFWAADVGGPPQITMSNDQKFVLLRNPSVTH